MRSCCGGALGIIGRDGDRRRTRTPPSDLPTAAERAGREEGLPAYRRCAPAARGVGGAPGPSEPLARLPPEAGLEGELMTARSNAAMRSPRSASPRPASAPAVIRAIRSAYSSKAVGLSSAILRRYSMTPPRASLGRPCPWVRTFAHPPAPAGPTPVWGPA